MKFQGKDFTFRSKFFIYFTLKFGNIFSFKINICVICKEEERKEFQCIGQVIDIDQK